MKNAVIKKLISNNAKDIVDFLYSTEKRQHLANWMKKRRESNLFRYTSADELYFTKLLGDYKDDDRFRTFVNKHFPCWTGTLTCFMLNYGASAAYEALSNGTVVRKCQESLNSTDAAYKVVGILFTLELIDKWEDIKLITGSKEKALVCTAQYDPYDCVPVPNTAYIQSQTSPIKSYQGSCMVSTIRNLLYILCRDTSDSTAIVTENMTENIRGAFNTSIYEIPGTTSGKTLRKFAHAILPNITELYEPTLELFICTLNSILKKDLRIEIPIPTPEQYIHGRKFGIKNEKLIKSLLEKITNHNNNITVETKKPTKLTHTWPEEVFIITDKTVKKKITLAFGKCGLANHMEIIDIKNEQS